MKIMSPYDTTNHENAGERSGRAITGDGSDEVDYQRYRSIQNKENVITRSTKSGIKDTDNSVRGRRNSSKLHRLLIQLPPSCEGGDNKITAGHERRAMITPKSNMGLPPSNRQIHTTNSIDRYSSIMTVNGSLFSPTSSSSSLTTAETPTTTTTSFGMASTNTDSRKTLRASSLSSLLSYLDNEDADFHGTEEDQKDEFDDEESQPILSIKSPMISKLFRHELELSDEGSIDNHDCGSKEDDGRDRNCQDKWYAVGRNISGYIVSSCVCEFACALSLWICLLIVFFNWSIKNASGCLEFQDRVSDATSTFRTLQGDGRNREDCTTAIAFQGIVMFILMLGSVKLMGLTLGKWGNAMIKAYEAALTSSSNFQEADSFQKFYREEHFCSSDSDVRARHCCSCELMSDEEGRRRPRSRRSTAGIVSDDKSAYYGSLSPSPSEYLRHRCHYDLLSTKQPTKSGDLSEDEKSLDLNSKTENPFVLFPRLRVLLVQSLIVTALLLLCLNFIRWDESPQEHLRHTLGTTESATTTTIESSFAHDLNERDSTSGFNPSISTPAARDRVDRNALSFLSEGRVPTTLLSMLLSVMTFSHWAVYIAQRHIQKSQQTGHMGKQ
eukprot:jgi/Psemu1/291450/fgenesh1_pg.704_\